MTTFSDQLASLLGWAVIVACCVRVLVPLALEWIIKSIEDGATRLGYPLTAPRCHQTHAEPDTAPVVHSPLSACIAEFLGDWAHDRGLRCGCPDCAVPDFKARAANDR